MNALFSGWRERNHPNVKFLWYEDMRKGNDNEDDDDDYESEKSISDIEENEKENTNERKRKHECSHLQDYKENPTKKKDKPM